MFAAIGFVVILGAAAAAAYLFRDKIFKPAAKPVPTEHTACEESQTHRSGKDLLRADERRMGAEPHER